MSTGIDIGTSEIKLIELSKINNNPAVAKICSKSTWDDLNTFDPEKLEKANWVASIKDICSEVKINPKRIKSITSAISGRNLSVKEITTLEMNEDELFQSLEFEAKKHIPLDGTKVIMDYHIIGENTKEVGKIDVLLVATTKNLINQHNQLLSEIGFKKTGIFDATPIAITNLLLHTKGMPEEGTDVILNIGNKSSTIIAFGNNQEYFTRELNISGHHFNQQIMKKNDISYSDAENLKKEKGINSFNTSKSSSETDFSIQVAEKTIFDNLVEEIRKTLRYYMKTNPQAYFNKLYLTGGSANLIGLRDLISTNRQGKL